MIEIGDNVTISTNVSLITHDNSAIKIYDQGTDFVGKIVIGNNCFIGTGSIILPGVTLADNTIVGAGSVVTKSVNEMGKIIGGNPAKQIGSVKLLREKHMGKVFDFKGKNSNEKKDIIMKNPDMWICK